MSQCRIRVLKRTLNRELAGEYINQAVELCDSFQEGQEFLISEGLAKPKGFCEWAWNDVFKTVVTLSRGGNFNSGLFEGWMKDDKSLITCCTDGIRPVIFLVERID